MEICDLEIDVNGEHIFLLDKKTISGYSGRLRKLFGKYLGKKERTKVVFNDFPGGTECFELIARFCYSNGQMIDFTPSNVFLLNSAADFLEMTQEINGMSNLLQQTEIFFRNEIHYWTWSEFLLALKHFQSLVLPSSNSSVLLQELLNVLVRKFAFPLVSSPCSSLSENSSFQFSGDFSVESSKYYNPKIPFWFQDLVFLNINLFKKIVNTMVSQNIDHVTICHFIFYYQKSRFADVSSVDKCKIMESIIHLLSLLSKNSIPRKGLFYNFRETTTFNIEKCCKVKMENLIGSRLDEATINDLLVRAPRGKKYAYDVNLILRLLKVFMEDIYEHSQFCIYRLQKVGLLIDLYMAEVAPDPRLKSSKFLALALALPDIARESHDKMYQAIDIYLQMHRGIYEEQKRRLFGAVNLDELSKAALKHLAENAEAQNILCPKHINSSIQESKKVSKFRLSNPNKPRPLPRLCRT